MPPATGGGAARGQKPARPATEAHEAIERFLHNSECPALLEPGEEQILLSADSCALEWRNNSLTLQAWNDERHLTRRVVGLGAAQRGRLELLVERFPRRAGTMLLVDLAQPRNACAGRQGARLIFREHFRRSLSRQFPGWRIVELSAEADLEHSLSPTFPRALLRKGTTARAAIGAAPDADDSNVLSFGLIWLDYLRRREPRLTIEGLTLVLPAGRVRTSGLRLRWLDRAAADYAIVAYSEEGYDDRLDLKDCGNLETRLDPCRTDHAAHEELLAPYVALPFVERVRRADGGSSLRVRGLEFARTEGARLVFGLDTKHAAIASNRAEILALASALDRRRTPETRDRAHALWSRNPEGWLESQVRASIEALDASLLPAPVYGQVPAFAGGDRGVIDLLAVDRRGRLAVLELKASEDIHLPLQALDYWMRVKWHLDQGDFGAQGYFPGVSLVHEPPRLLLVAPALDFHPSNEVVLRFFSPEVVVERFGVGGDWRQELRVMFRTTGKA